MPTFDTIREYARCWSDTRLRERAQLWPEPLTWSWFLGERCEPYSRADCLEILSVAVAHMQNHRVQLPIPLVQIWRARDLLERVALLDVMATIGAYLDEWDAGVRQTEGLQPTDAYIELTEALNVLTKST